MRKIFALVFQITPLQSATQLVKSVTITHNVGQVVVQVMEEQNFAENLAMMNLACPFMTQLKWEVLYSRPVTRMNR